MRLIKLFHLIPVIWLSVWVGDSHAQSFCFLSASSYYEQVYCELQARGQTRGLPPFHQFKRNDEVIQAAILKRPAQRNGIELPAPKKATSSRDNRHFLPDVVDATPIIEQAPRSTSSSPAIATCRLEKQQIHCGNTRYQLIGNRANRHLAEGALTDENLMALPSYQGADDTVQIQRYLVNAYRAYLGKMHEVGLAGATMTYEKFAFLFYDLRDKNLNFSQRFETMYTFLKKDKKTLAVSEKLNTDDQLQLSDCANLSGGFMVCSRAGRNYLFIAGS